MDFFLEQDTVVDLHFRLWRKLRCCRRLAVGKQVSTGHLHLIGSTPFCSKIKSTSHGVPCKWGRIRESSKLRSHARRAVHEQQSTGLLHLIGSTPSLPIIKGHPNGVPFYYGAGYGSRTRLHGLGSRCITDIRILRCVRTLYQRGMKNSTPFCRRLGSVLVR